MFTIPKRLCIFFRYDRKLLGELASCAWRALNLYFDGYFDGAGVTPGAVGFLQTSGELLNFHPHVHVLVTDGGFTPDGTFRPLAWYHSQQQGAVPRRVTGSIPSLRETDPPSSRELLGSVEPQALEVVLA